MLSDFWKYVIGINWTDAFSFDTPLLEIFLRGSVVYLSLFFILRVVLKREQGGVGITDLLVIVLIADASQNAMAGSYNSIPDGIMLVLTIIFWSYALNWLGYKFSAFERLIQPRPLKLVEHGEMLRRNLKQELITEDELISQLRVQGINELSEVEEAYMESDGRVSAIQYQQEHHPQPERQRG